MVEGSGVAVSYGIGCSSDLALLCLWRRPVATAVIGPQAWELPYAVGAALKETKRLKKKKKKIVTGIIYLLLQKVAICLKPILLLFNLILPANNDVLY